MIHRSLSAASLAALALLAMPAAHAARSYDNCTGFIDSVPASISTQGTWCLRKDLATSSELAIAINVAANNVTIDCNDFKLGALASGPATAAVGVNADNRQNVTVRNCNIRGFLSGVHLSGGGHVVEDNRFNGNTYLGIDVDAQGSTIRGNTVAMTGGSTRPGFTFASFAINAAGDVDVVDNTIDGVFAIGDNGNSQGTGIFTWDNQSGTVSGNRIRGVVGMGTGDERAIYNGMNGRLHVFDNVMTGSGRANSKAITCDNNLGVAARNLSNGFTAPLNTCANGGGNFGY
jgi:parallel beta-helix repeat protein